MNLEEIGLRIRSHLRLKLLLSVVLTGGIWGLYLFLQRHPVFPGTAVKGGWVDRNIPCVPGAVYLYESIWLLMPIAPWLMNSRADLYGYTKGIASIAAVTFAVFFFFPTSCPRPKDLPAGNLLYGALVHIDSELNAWPSLHAAFAVFHGACCQAVFATGRGLSRVRWFVWVWTFGIIGSTLLTKQHVLVDALAGALLGAVGYAVYSTRKSARPK
jgi:membrane-associated phospholipid phosphatase